MDYRVNISHDLTGLTDREISVIQAGLVLLANSATYGVNNGYPEYKAAAAAMLKTVDAGQTDDR